MKDYQFFAEFSDAAAKRKGNRKNGFAGAVNCVAVATWNRGRPSVTGHWVVDAYCSVFDHADSAVSMSEVARNFTQKNCKRCSEAEARKIHPTLFMALDNEAKQNVAEKGHVAFNWEGHPRTAVKVWHMGPKGANGLPGKQATSLTQFWCGRAPSWWVQFEDSRETYFCLLADLVKYD